MKSQAFIIALIIGGVVSVALGESIVGSSVVSETATTQPAAVTPRQATDDVLHSALAVLRNPSLSPADRSSRICQLVSSDIDLQTFSRLTIGSYWHDLSDAQHDQFVTAFTKYLCTACANLCSLYTDQDLNTVSDHAESHGDWTVVAKVSRKHANAPAEELATVNFRLRQSGGTWKIIDVTTDGVSMLAGYRSQFQDLMKAHGFDGVMQTLREKNGAAH